MSLLRRPAPTIVRAFRPPTPELIHVEIHDPDCGCRFCPNGDRLTARDMGILATIAAAVTTLAMFAIDPAGTAAALAATIGWS